MNLLRRYCQVDPDYRDGAVWTFNDYTLSLVEGIVDLNGRQLLNNAADGINVGRANQYLLGYPVVIDQAWANYADGGTNKFRADSWQRQMLGQDSSSLSLHSVGGVSRGRWPHPP